jgi:hypothetical protein
MNKDQYLEYVDHFNNKRYDAVTSYFAPDVMVEYYTNWANPETPARTLRGPQAFIDSYKLLHEHCREILELRDFLVDGDLMAVELYTEFHCFEDHPTFSFRPLKKGDVIIMTNWVIYTLKRER